MKYGDVVLAVVDGVEIDDKIIEKFERAVPHFYYSEAITVIASSFMNLSFQIGDDLLRDIASEVCNGYYRKFKLVRSKKILFLLNAKAVYTPDLCFSTDKRKSSVTGDFQDLQDYLLDLLTQDESQERSAV